MLSHVVESSILIEARANWSQVSPSIIDSEAGPVKTITAQQLIEAISDCKHPLKPSVMPRQSAFLHACGHTGIGPIIRYISSLAQTIGPFTDINEKFDIIQLQLPLECPFCETSLHVEPGGGVLTILTPTKESPCASEWRILKVCRPEDIEVQDWDIAHKPGGVFRQMAWIPKPCSEVRTIRDLQGTRRHQRRETRIGKAVSYT